MNRPERAAALLIAALVLSGCAASSTSGEPVASDTSTPATPSAPASEAPSSEAPAESPEPTADGAADPLREQCETVVQQRFVAASPRLATAEDYAAAAETIGFQPAAPTCGVVYVPESGGTFTLHVYVDRPEVAAALADGFSDSGWTKTQEQGAGYVTDVYADGEVTAGISPIGVDNPVSAWGTIWSGMDVTLFGVEQP